MQRDVLAGFPDAPFQVYVIWMPVLARDTRAGWDDSLIDDRRAVHFWDEGAKVGRWLHGFAPFSDHPDAMAWDVFAVYGPGALWPVDRPPTDLIAHGWTVTDDRRELFLALQPMIRGPWHRLALPALPFADPAPANTMAR